MIRPHQAKRFAEENGIPVPEYLQEWHRFADKRVMELTLDIEELVDAAAEAETEDEASIYLVWVGDLGREMEQIRRDIRTAEEMIHPPKNQPKDRITDEDIARAKEYPVNQVVEFDRQGRALAWCHDDHKPSLYYGARKNVAVCPVCGKTFNAVDVLMARDDLSFIEAVKRLR